ncbi:MAG: hypothetical protein R3E08_03005 [Thiotrichaceae bacterium]
MQAEPAEENEQELGCEVGFFDRGEFLAHNAFSLMSESSGDYNSNFQP